MKPASHIALAAVVLLAACGTDRADSPGIALDTVVQLQTSSGPGEVSGPPTSVVHLADGRYLVVEGGPFGGKPLVFGADGAFLDYLGRTGDGPGEFREVLAATQTRGDSVVVASRRSLRMLDPGLTQVRDAALPLQPQRIWSDTSGNLLALGWRETPDSRGARLHLHDPSGVYLRSLSAVDSGLINVDFVAVSDGGTGWWTVPMDGTYRIDHWSHDGHLDSGRRIAASWHPQVEFDPAARMGPESPPLPRVQGLSRAGDGKLWVLGTLAAEGWKEALASVETSGGADGTGSGLVFVSPDQLLDGVIDLIDLESGRQVASLELPELVSPVSGDTLFTAREDSSGFWHVAIVRATLSPSQVSARNGN